MAQQIDTVVAPDAAGGPGARPGRSWRARLRSARVLIGILPFTIYVFLGLVLPAIAITVGAFQDSTTGEFTLSNIKTAASGIYLHGFGTTLGVAVITSIVPGVVGFLVAYAIFTAKRGAVLRRCVITASGVFANFGGVPLAFLFIATLGSTGMVTQWLTDIGLNPYTNGFNLYTFSGIVVVYMYFQIPLMVLVVTPAIDGLRLEWAEAAEMLGASSWQYWRLIALPILWPSVMGAALLLFANAFGAIATAYALTGSSFNIAPILLYAQIRGDVLHDPNLGYALALGMLAITGASNLAYFGLRARSDRWLR